MRKGWTALLIGGLAPGDSLAAKLDLLPNHFFAECGCLRSIPFAWLDGFMTSVRSLITVILSQRRLATSKHRFTLIQEREVL